ncbi:GntR family transcriptional regulator [Sulfitobacter donghicola]|nr:GntR family transcriptional regulator [Sulfitobacter donghicola]KIN67482.1 Transcriptional regulator, GntR family [Sulfitobacter donghicola DSW-25 = KCTC 12864 = JCM 14565]
MTPKSDQAYEYLRRRILDGSIPPDAPLRIQTLGQESSFGSTPVREALRRLEAESLVVSAINRGFRSAPISIEEIRDLENARLVIETALLRESIQQGGDQWESGIVASHYQLSKLDLPIDTQQLALQDKWAEKHQCFHEALITGANSKWLSAFQRQITEQLDRILRFTLGDGLVALLEENQDLKDLLRQSLRLEHHTFLMQATLDRDEKSATALLEEHFQFASRFFSEVFSAK